MEIVVLIIMVLVSLSFLLKLTFYDTIGRIVLSLLSADFVMWVCDDATAQSKTQIADWLSQPDIMLDTSVWLTFDVAFQLFFCVMDTIKIERTLTVKEKILYKICLWIPGILIFPVLFAVLTGLIFSLTGTDFVVISRTLALILFVTVPLVAYGLRRLSLISSIGFQQVFLYR